MASILVFASALSEEQQLRNVIQRIGLPEIRERLAEEAETRSMDLNLADLPEGVCFAKIPWGEGNRHFLWSALNTVEHKDGSGLYGATKTTSATVEYYGLDEKGPSSRSNAIQLVDRLMFEKAEIYQGPDPYLLFDESFADYPLLRDRKSSEQYDILMCLRSVERFRMNPFEPHDQVGARRLVQFVEERRATIRKVNSVGLDVGLTFGQPMID